MKVDFQDWMFRLRRSGTQPFTNHIRTRTHTGLRCHRNSALRMIPIKLLIISHTLNLTDCVQVSDRHTHTELQSTQTPAVFTTQTCLFHDIISKAKSQINKRKKTLAVAQLSGQPQKKKKKVQLQRLLNILTGGFTPVQLLVLLMNFDLWDLPHPPPPPWYLQRKRK